MPEAATTYFAPEACFPLNTRYRRLRVSEAQSKVAPVASHEHMSITHGRRWPTYFLKRHIGRCRWPHCWESFSAMPMASGDIRRQYCLMRGNWQLFDGTNFSTFFLLPPMRRSLLLRLSFAARGISRAHKRVTIPIIYFIILIYDWYVLSAKCRHERASKNALISRRHLIFSRQNHFALRYSRYLH